MSIAESIKALRDRYSITQAELGEIAGLSSKAIGAWESGRAEPRIGAVEKIAAHFGIPKTKVLGWDDECEFTSEETEMIKKYRTLDSFGAKAVDNVLGVEYDRCLTSASSVMDNLRPIRYYQRVASAGSGQVVFDGLPADFVYVPCTDEYRRVAYAIGVNGDSMEPDFSDGDTLLVEPTTDLRIGEIGIFYTDGCSYVKELGYGELISLNPDYGPIRLNEESRCMGRVIGKL